MPDNAHRAPEAIHQPPGELEVAPGLPGPVSPFEVVALREPQGWATGSVGFSRDWKVEIYLWPPIGETRVFTGAEVQALLDSGDLRVKPNPYTGRVTSEVAREELARKREGS